MSAGSVPPDLHRADLKKHRSDAVFHALGRGGRAPVLVMSSLEGEKKRKNVAVHVTRSAETSQRKRHPWLFDSDLRKISHEGSAPSDRPLGPQGPRS